MNSAHSMHTTNETAKCPTAVVGRKLRNNSMKLILTLGLWLSITPAPAPAPAHAAITGPGSAHTCSGTNSGGTTSTAIDTSGMNFIVLSISYDSGGTISVSDSKSNTWTALTASTANSARNVLYYAENATVGTGHTFTASGANTFASLCVAAFAGVKVSSAFDQQNGGTCTGTCTSVATGSTSPGENGELVVAGLITNNGPTSIYAVDSSMTISDQIAFSAANYYSNALAYIIQTSAGAVNATWSWMTGTHSAAARNATFKAQPTRRCGGLALLGVGC